MFLAHNFIHRSPQNDLHKSRGLFFILFARLLHLILITCLLLTKNIYLFIDIKSIRRHYYFSCDLHMSRTTQHNPESIKQEEKSFFLFKTYSYMKWNEINIQSRQIFKYITHTRMYNVSYVKRSLDQFFYILPVSVSTIAAVSQTSDPIAMNAERGWIIFDFLVFILIFAWIGGK